MEEGKLQRLIALIMHEGAPLFDRGQIEKMLRRMNKESELDSRCCGNCELLKIDAGGLFCKKEYIHYSLVYPWKVCGHWISDGADNTKRLCGIDS